MIDVCRAEPLLTEANRTALAYVRSTARRERERHLARISRVLSSASRVGVGVEALTAAGRARGRVTVNFHPDRLLADGRSVAEALRDEGTYRSQFESRISNGGLTAFRGGDRDRWEEVLFGRASHAPGVREWERPKYGGLNLMQHSNGACPRFGSCHLRLKADVRNRSTFSFGDSVLEPTDVATIDAFEPVLASLLERVAHDGNALGRRGLDVTQLVARLLDPEHLAATDPLRSTQSRTLDDYIEVQVHGPLRLSVDVEALVIDPSFRATPTGDVLLTAAERHAFRTGWHPGSALRASDVPDDALAIDTDIETDDLPRWRAFCADGRAARLAQRVIDDHSADGRHLEAAAIGEAAASVIRHPDRWRDWGATDEVLQRLKDLWLILVVHGAPPR